ncbi:hypothetical protein [uncultured Thiodictyon sp.]|uniref:hypothetical protein n=1 Tax=uncultured Thiodictyon sp. TaxID=1846217 RepID=UPI0025D52BD5|nr:hypothetical protein [uncultured Thiodictyon sp.]
MNDPAESPKGWYSRGYLPHLDKPGLLQSVTFHLGDALPRQVVLRLQAMADDDDLERRREIERLLDAGYGACWLNRPEIAALVEDSLLHFDGIRYRMLAWTVMPNHVHIDHNPVKAGLVDRPEAWPFGSARLRES